MRPNYKKFHWRYFARKGENLHMVSRKTKKAVKKEFDEIAAEWDEYLSSDEYKFDQLPDCKWCGGGGVYRDHPSDSGYGCPDCYGTGKTGWKFGENGKKVITHKER